VRAAVLALALLTGCTAGGTEEPDGRPRRDIAARPESLPPAPPASVAPSSSASARPGASGPASPGAASGSVAPSAPGGSAVTRPSGPPGQPGTPAPGAPYRAVASTDDRRGDAGTTTPGYGDLASVTIEDNGANARVTVRMHGTVPATVPAEETMGIGVDFYRSALQVESDYQLFADGQPDGWFAYLHTPKGFVRYQGTFGIGGDRLVFTVPWSALGSPASGNFSAFADWTRQATPSNRAGEDRAPGLGNAAFSR